jgi:ABC-type phosphate transport system substrate-binding protein
VKAGTRVSLLHVESNKCHCYSLPPVRFLFLLIVTLSLLGICSAPAGAQNSVVLVGSGSSVPAPLYSRWAQECGKRNPQIQMRYLPVGTSEGIKKISRGPTTSGLARLDSGTRRGKREG